MLAAVDRLSSVLISPAPTVDMLIKGLDEYRRALPGSSIQPAATHPGGGPDIGGAGWVAEGHHYSCGELGLQSIPGGRRTYDRALRIADGARWLRSRSLPNGTGTSLREGRTVTDRRWRYVNFVVWRKLRVVDKSNRRRQPFTCRWYQLQVIDHLIESEARLAGTVAPPSHLRVAEHLDFLDLHTVGQLTDPARLTSLLVDTGGFLEWGWRMFGQLQDRLVESGRLHPAAVADPLATQWEIEYWKYENLFI